MKRYLSALLIYSITVYTMFCSCQSFAFKVENEIKTHRTNQENTIRNEEATQENNCIKSLDYWEGASAYISGNYPLALKKMGPLAELGEPRSQFLLGKMYESGQGVFRDEQKAFQWIKLSAEQGYTDAQFELGKMFYQGQAVKQDFPAALNWYSKAAEEGMIKAQYNLGLMFQLGEGTDVDHVSAAKWFQAAAEKGFASAQCNLGYLYNEGLGVVQNYQKAVYYYERAAKNGHTLAKYNLGLMYLDGQGVIQDYVQAYKWFHEAAKEGLNTSQYNLALMCSKGLGTNKDFLYAYAWANVAAANSHNSAFREKAVKLRDEISSRLSSGQRDLAQSLSRLLVAEPEKQEVLERKEEPKEQNENRTDHRKTYGTGFVVHPTKAYFDSCRAMILSLKNCGSLNPYACLFKVLILLFVPSKGPVEIGKS